MEIVRNKIRLDKRYITEPLDSDSLTKLMASGNAGIVHRIYLIKNELKKNSQNFPLTISSFGEDNLQELYVVDYMGTIYKFISN